MQQEGYGSDWTHWDNYINSLYPRPDDVKYENWCVFRSPKGVLMAFYNKSYGDIKVINLETGQTVVEEFYSHFDQNKENNWYRSHTNVSTYVPNFWIESEKYTNKEGVEDETFYTLNDSEIDEPITQEYLAKWGQFQSLPFAFNAWTVWAADFEFYVDILDLREIDNGIVRKWRDIQYVITRDAKHVRNFIKHNTDADGPDDITSDFKVLEERWKERFSSKDGDFKFYDMYKNRKQGDNEMYSITDKPQWMVDKERWEKSKKEPKS